jgi:hypothetical protein
MESYEQKLTEASEEARLKQASMYNLDRELERESAEDLDPAEVEGRVNVLQSLLKKYAARLSNSKKKSLLSSGDHNSMHELSSLANWDEDSQSVPKDRRFLNNQDADLIFPTQLKSYYASSEL